MGIFFLKICLKNKRPVSVDVTLRDLSLNVVKNYFCRLIFLFLWKNNLKSFGFFIECYINLHGLFNARVILIEEQQWYYLTHTWEFIYIYIYIHTYVHTYIYIFMYVYTYTRNYDSNLTIKRFLISKIFIFNAPNAQQYHNIFQV